MITNFDIFKDMHKEYMSKMERENELIEELWNPYKDFNVNTGTINDLINVINDCCICCCFGCRNFEPRVDSNKHISKKECNNYMKYYLNKEYDPYTDDCWCNACIEKYNKQKINRVRVYIDDNDMGYVIDSNSVQRAKALAIKFGFYEPEDYTKLKYEIID